jgi:hypothetical protein
LLGAGTPTPSFPQKYFENVTHFSHLDYASPKHHIPPPNHHKLTIKTPHKNHQFFKTPSKNARKTTKTPLHHHPNFFLQNNRFRIEEWTGRANGSAPSLKLPWRKIK